MSSYGLGRFAGIKKTFSMDIGAFKELQLEQKLHELKYSGNLLGPYDKNGEPGDPKLPGDIYELYDFWVFLSEDEQTVIPSRRNPLPEE